MAYSKWILIVATTIIGAGFLVSMFILRRNRRVVSKPIPNIVTGTIATRGLQVPVLRTYSGIKRLAPVTFVENKMSPKFVLFEDHFVYRVLRTRRVLYDEVEQAYSFSSRYYNKLRINFIHSGVFFMVVFANQETLNSVLNFLAKKGIHAQTGN